jgi:Ca2+:H+ antiporter
VSLKWSVHWLLIAMPVSAVLDAMGAAAPLVFFCAAVAIVPLASLIVHSTEHLATRTGPALGGLLNATFGNLPELIIALVALRAGLLEMVRASLIGALLANLLLASASPFCSVACVSVSRSTIPRGRATTHP